MGAPHGRFVLVAAVVALAAPRGARGWRSREHRAIGAESYIAACKRLEPLQDRDADTKTRFKIACSNLKIQALLYGQGTAVSGDFTSEPGDLVSGYGAAVVTSTKNYWQLALTNGAHFHPLATRTWREFHKQSIDEALAASRKLGAEQIALYEQAFYDSAFGDHFLQDSFAAGHMGFNRHASSAAAAKAYHDEWGRRGRWVSNRRGAVWKTYGDGRLDLPESRAARAHVLAASTESVYGMVSAFVLGTFDPAADLAVWSEVAFTIEDPEILPDLDTLFAGSEKLERPKLLPLLAVKRPAIKDGIIGVWTAGTMRFDDVENPSGAMLFGGDLIIPGLGARAEVGVGFGFAGSMTEPRLAIDAGLVRGLGLSWDGLLSHEVDFGALFMIGSEFEATLRLSYRPNIEAGDWLLRLDIGPSFDIGDAEFGVYMALGLSKVLHAAGGGGFFN